jgi:glutamate decarboxylase
MVEIHDRCVNILARMYNAPEQGTSTGTSTAGSSEALLISCLSHKVFWRNKRKAEGKDYSKPNMVFGTNAQVSFQNFVRLTA